MANKVVTIQKTNKQWKLVYLISITAMIIGGILLFVGPGTNNEFLTVLAIVLLAVGLIGFLGSKIGGWWTNG